jgi:phage tail tape-measure protein
MRNILFASVAIAVLVGMPSIASAEDNVGGATAGAATGAVAGAVVGGPVGAVVGGTVGATIGAGATSEPRRDVVIEHDAPSVDSRTCVTHADGTRVCKEISR